MSLDAREVHRVAALARLCLTAGEERLFAEQLGRVVAHIDRIRSQATTRASPESPEPGPEALDDPAPCLGHEQFLGNAPATRGAFLVVPKVLESGDG